MNTEYRDDELIVNYTNKPFSGTGIVRQVTWENPETQAALRQLFHRKDNERLIAVVVNNQGIKAHFEFKETA